MIIQKWRIHNPQRYLYALHPGDKFYVAVPLSDEDYSKLRLYGIIPGAPARIPVPFHTATTANAEGRWLPDKKLPKQIRYIEHAYHVVDWHGNDHYGVCWQPRRCYQRKFIPPTEIAFVIEGGVLYSPLLANDEGSLSLIKSTMNVVLEMLGRCELWTVERVPATPPVEQEEVPWQILPPGDAMYSDWRRYLQKTTTQKTKAQQVVIYQRHEHIWSMSPEFCVLGTQNFWGYVVYGFPAENLYVFECNQLNNATYIFRGNWEDASKLSKSEILTGHMQESRLYHTGNWYQHIREMLADAKRRVA